MNSKLKKIMLEMHMGKKGFKCFMLLLFYFYTPLQHFVNCLFFECFICVLILRSIKKNRKSRFVSETFSKIH